MPPASASVASAPTQYLRCFIVPLSSSDLVDCDVSSFRCRWHPAQHVALERRDRDVEGEAEEADHENPCPGLVELEDARPGQDQHADGVQRAAEVLADDGADHRE